MHNKNENNNNNIKIKRNLLYKQENNLLQENQQIFTVHIYTNSSLRMFWHEQPHSYFELIKNTLQKMCWHKISLVYAKGQQDNAVYGRSVIHSQNNQILWLFFFFAYIQNQQTKIGTIKVQCTKIQE